MPRSLPTYTVLRALAGASALVTAFTAGGCGSSTGNKGDDGSGTGATDGTSAGSTAGSTAGTTAGASGGFDLGGNTAGGASGSGVCEGLECKQVACDSGGTTSLSGVVYDPSGTVPLYNAIVYVPNATVEPFSTGTVTCDRCGTAPSGKPIATALTDAAGKFTLKNVPVADNVPLVIQIGRWRRQITVPSVTKCGDTALEATQTRLPRTQAEGDIPRIAVTTGGADALECFFRRLLGSSAAEITAPDGPGRVHLYTGISRYTERCVKNQSAASCTGGFQTVNCNPNTDNRCRYVNEDGSRIGGAPPPAVPAAKATDLWGSANGGTLQSGAANQASWPAASSKLMGYDMVVLSCEGSENNTTKDDQARKSLAAYLDAGGRVFASHYHYTWMKNKPSDLASWAMATTANWQDNSEVGDRTVKVDQSFAKGQAFADWLVNVNASTTKGDIDMKALRRNVTSVNASTARSWVYDTDNANGTGNPLSTKYYSFNAPIGAAENAQCGRGVYTDIHIASDDNSGGTFPDNCSTSKEFSAQEKALLFLLFDLSACVQDDAKPPAPPPVIN